MAVPIVDCALPEVLAALSGENPAADVRYLQPPAGFGERPLRPAPPDAKPPYGTNLANHYDTENFTINWANGDASEETAVAAGAALEAGWQALVVEQGWKAPVSSDQYLVWVVLDPSIAGTGYTTVYTTDDYPGGYPVIYLNSEYFSYDDFFVALAQHEFDHALQFARRNYWSGGDDEAWYWEASANWAPYLVGPESISFDYSTAWYADDSELSYANMNGTHQYGMFVLNAYLDEMVAPQTMQQAWVESESGDGWLTVLENASGLPPDQIWGQFSAAYGEQGLAESAGWTVPTRERVEDGIAGNAEKLGSRYYRAAEAVVISLNVSSGQAVISSRGVVSDSISVAAGDVFAVTATARDGAEWTLTVSSPPEDTGCEPCDTAEANDTGPQNDSDNGDDNGGSITPGTDETGGCGCESSGPPSLLGMVAALAFLRRPRVEGA